MLTGETPKAEQKSIEDELATKSTGHSFRFLYVTPEKIAKAKRFVSKLEKLYHNGGLARVVIGAVSLFPPPHLLQFCCPYRHRNSLSLRPILQMSVTVVRAGATTFGRTT